MTDLAEPTKIQPGSPTPESEPAEKKLPWHLRGNFAPVSDEVTLTDELRVTASGPLANRLRYPLTRTRPKL